MAVERLTPERRKELTRTTLIDAATELFARKGFGAASLDEIAEAAGFFPGGRSASTSTRRTTSSSRCSSASTSVSSPPTSNGRSPVRAFPVDPAATASTWKEIHDAGGVDQVLLQLEFRTYALRNPAFRARAAELEAHTLAATAEFLTPSAPRSRACGRRVPIEQVTELLHVTSRGLVERSRRHRRQRRIDVHRVPVAVVGRVARRRWGLTVSEEELMNRCTVQVFRGALYEECGAEVDADGVSAAGHGSNQALAKAAEHHHAAPEMNLTPGTWPVTRKFFSVDDHIVEPADVWSNAGAGQVPRRRAARGGGRRPRVLGVRGGTGAHHGSQCGGRQAAGSVDDGTHPVHRHDPRVLRPGRPRPRHGVGRHHRVGVLPDAPPLRRGAVQQLPRQGPRRRLRAGVERFHPRRMVRCRTRRCSCPCRSARSGIPSPRRQRSGARLVSAPRALLPGGDQLPRPPLLLQRLLGPGLGRGHRGRHPRVHAHRVVGQRPRSNRPTRRSRSPSRWRSWVRPERGRPHDEPGTPQVPDGEVRDVRRRHRVGTGGIGACRPPGRPAPVLVG